jgi:hypothetical protein
MITRAATRVERGVKEGKEALSLRIRTWHDKEFQIAVLRSDTVLDVKRAIYRETNIIIPEQVLVYMGLRMGPDTRPLERNWLRENSAVRLHLRLFGFESTFRKRERFVPEWLKSPRQSVTPVFEGYECVKFQVPNPDPGCGCGWCEWVLNEGPLDMDWLLATIEACS